MQLRRVSLVLALAAAAPALFTGQATTKWTTVTPVEQNEPLNNPFMGWGIWAGPRYLDGRPFTLEYNTKGFGDNAPLFSWLLIDWMWADLEPREGQYNWHDLDTIIDYWAARGKQVYLRIWITDDPGWDNFPGNEVFPSWLEATGVKFREYLSQGKFKKKEPDYVDPSYKNIYLPKAKRFLSALAERYDKPGGAVIMWGAMGYGQWGEWHTLWSHYPWPNEQIKHDVLAGIVNMYADVFKVHPVMISYCPDWDQDEATSLNDFLYRQALDVALKDRFALARHAFIDGLHLWDHLTMEKYWQDTPMLAEGNWTYTEVKDDGTHGTLQQNIEVMEEWHSNYGHFYVDADSYKRVLRDDQAAFADGLRSGGLGYRLVPTKVSWLSELRSGDLFIMRSTWVNRNAGRLYLRYPLRIYFVDAEGRTQYSAQDRSFTETEWVKGEEYPVTTLLKTPDNIKPGMYDVRIALTDAQDKPAIRLPLTAEDTESRYTLGSIRILPRRQKAHS